MGTSQHLSGSILVNINSMTFCLFVSLFFLKKRLNPIYPTTLDPDSNITNIHHIGLGLYDPNFVMLP